MRYHRNGANSEQDRPSQRGRTATASVVVEGGGNQMRGMINRMKELSGIYGLGFERESFLGVSIPLGIVVVLGAIGWFLIRGL